MWCVLKKQRQPNGVTEDGRAEEGCSGPNCIDKWAEYPLRTSYFSPRVRWPEEDYGLLAFFWRASRPVPEHSRTSALQPWRPAAALRRGWTRRRQRSWCGRVPLSSSSTCPSAPSLESTPRSVGFGRQWPRLVASCLLRASNSVTGFSPLPASRSSADVLCGAQVQRDEDGAPGAAFRLLLLPKQVAASASYKPRFLQHFNYQLFGNNGDDLCWECQLIFQYTNRFPFLNQSLSVVLHVHCSSLSVGSVGQN
jgi:hypothetical protein